MLSVNQHHGALDCLFITLSEWAAYLDGRGGFPLLEYTDCVSVSSQFAFARIKPCLCRAGEIFISPRQIALQILANFCTNEINVDCILSNLTTEQLRIFSHALLSIIHLSVEDVDREYCLTIIYSLCKRNRSLVHFFYSHRIAVDFIFNYLELFEYNQQQYLIATLASCCYASSSGSMPISVNHSNDMMIDSCVQLLLLFAPITGKNHLRSYEDRLVEMSSSIYFEQRILRAFADILYVMKLWISRLPSLEIRNKDHTTLELSALWLFLG